MASCGVIVQARSSSVFLQQTSVDLQPSPVRVLELTCSPHRLTTTRVAQRAGVSVGTMYQYFPHKQALFYALNERYLDVLADKVEAAYLAQHGAGIGQMVEALVATY